MMMLFHIKFLRFSHYLENIFILQDFKRYVSFFDTLDLPSVAAVSAPVPKCIYKILYMYTYVEGEYKF